MPGIAGLITRAPREHAEPLLRRMVVAMQHEAFYRSGTWIDESLGVYVGWSALEKSFADGMPLYNEKKDVVLVFSGEEYPEPGLAARLAAQGHVLEQGHASYLVHAYEQDPDFPRGLNGRFHALVADRRGRIVRLFNDRYGLHRLYYHHAGDSFFFAAEAKAILAVRPELRTVDPVGLGEFLSCGCVFDGRTIFDRVSVVPGAADWTFRCGSLVRRRTYFNPEEWERQAGPDGDDRYERFRDAVKSNLPRYFNGSERIGVALTGGLDTRAIMAWRRAPAGSLCCYTFGSEVRDTQDVAVAKQVAQICGQPHETIPVGKEFLSRFAHYAERSIFLTDGCVDLSHAPDLYFSERARQIAPVKIVGTYASEVLTPAPAFEPATLAPGLVRHDLSRYVRDAERTYRELRREHPVTFAVFRQTPWWHFGIMALEQTQLTVRAPYLDNDVIRAVYTFPLDGGAARDVRQRLIADANPALAALRTDRGVGGSHGWLAAAVARTWLEFTYKAEYAYDYGMPQWLARADHLLAWCRLERLFLGRHKALHFRVWYRDALSPYVREMLLDQRSRRRPYFQPRAVESIVNGHLKGSRNHTVAIHKMLAVELIHRLFVDRA